MRGRGPGGIDYALRKRPLVADQFGAARAQNADAILWPFGSRSPISRAPSFVGRVEDKHQPAQRLIVVVRDVIDPAGARNRVHASGPYAINFPSYPNAQT
jgi:hypothetical protein